MDQGYAPEQDTGQYGQADQYAQATPEQGYGQAQGAEPQMTPEEEQQYLAMLMQMMKPHNKNAGGLAGLVKGNLIFVSLILAIVLVVLVVWQG